MARRGIKYKNHKYTNIDDILSDLTTSKTKESRIILPKLKPILVNLQNKGIREIQNVTMIFKDSGFNNKSLNLLLLFMQDNLPFRKFSNRDINKLNDCYRNILLNSVFLDFSNKIINLVENFVSNSCPDIHSHDFLIHKLEQFINEIQKKEAIIQTMNTTNLTSNKKDFHNIDDNASKIENNEQKSLYYTKLLHSRSDDDENYFDLNFDLLINI